MDLGLPSGTLWLDRMVGATSPAKPGLFYQWGDTIGHSIAEGYEFSLNNYTEKGLNLISTNLDDAHDAARAYYGPEAKMPSVSQFNELISNSVVSDLGNGIFLITSNINGQSIKIRGNGYVANLNHDLVDSIRVWSNAIGNVTEATAISYHATGATFGIHYNARDLGFNVMAVHS